MIGNLDADAVLTPTASGYLFGLLGENVRRYQDQSFCIVGSDTAPRPIKRRQVGGGPFRAEPDPALRILLLRFPCSAIYWLWFEITAHNRHPFVTNYILSATG